MYTVLRLINCITHSDCRENFFDQDKVKTRIQINGRNSKHIPKSCWEKVSTHYLDSGYKPKSIHLDFVEWGPWWENSHTLELPEDASIISLKKAKDQFRLLMARLKVLKQN